MQLSKHISQLLFNYDCVTVPGFGAFLGTQVSAELDTENELIYPPTKQISFNAQLKSNDGLLANSVALERQTSYEEALRLVHKEVVNWKTNLLKGQTIKIQRVGKIHFNEENNTVFVPTKDYNHLSNSFSLHPVKAQKINRVKTLKGTSKVIDLNNESNQNQSSSQNTKTNPLRHIAAAAAAVVIGYTGFMMYEDYSQNQLIMQETQVREKATQEALKAEFDLGDLPKLSIETIPQEAYYIITGAFSVESNADRLVNFLQQKGFVSAKKLIPNSYGLHLVAIGSRVDRVKAIDFLRQIQRTEMADAWMLKL